MIAPAGAGRSEPWVRGTVALLVSRFPKVTETFILREIAEMERQGQAVLLATLLRERGGVVHAEARPWLDRLLHLPPASWAVAAANARALVRMPRRWVRLAIRLLAGTWRRPGVALRTLALYPQAVALAERLRAERVAHVHAQFATYPATAAWVVHELAGIDFSFTVHAHDLFVHQLLLREKMAAARFVRTISELNGERLRAMAPAARVAVVHVGVETRRYLGEARASAAPLVLAVAALEPYKGLDVLIEACAELRRRGMAFRCEIIGRGRLRPSLERQVRARGLDDAVELVGARTEAEVAARMRAAAVVAQPSRVAADGQMEGIPVALMEALAASRPVVASRLSGIPELVEHGVSGWLVPPDDPLALADALARVLADPAAAARLGAAGREQVRRHFELSTTTAELLELLDRELAPLASGGALRGAGVERASLTGRIERRDSEVLFLLARTGGVVRRLVLKRQRARAGESAPPAARAAREHALLRELAVEGRAPEPLGFDAEAAEILMAACVGEPLDARLRRARRAAPAAVADDLRRAGVWLAEFRRRSPPGGSPAERRSALLGEIERSLTAARLGGRRSRRCRQLATALAASAAREETGLVRRHGDFWPGNLFLGPETVQAIDFEGVSSGLAGEDVGDFLVELRLFYLRPGGAGRFRAAADAFLSAAGDVGAAEIALAVQRAALARLAAPSPPAVPRLLRPLRRRTLRRLALAPETDA